MKLNVGGHPAARRVGRYLFCYLPCVSSSFHYYGSPVAHFQSPSAGAAVPYSMDNTPSNGNGIAVKRNLFNDSGTAIPGASWCYNHYNYYDYLQFHYIVLLLLLPPLSRHYCCHFRPTTVALHMEALGLYKISPHSAIHCCV